METIHIEIDKDFLRKRFRKYLLKTAQDDPYSLWTVDSSISWNDLKDRLVQQEVVDSFMEKQLKVLDTKQLFKLKNVDFVSSVNEILLSICTEKELQNSDLQELQELLLDTATCTDDIIECIIKDARFIKYYGNYEVIRNQKGRVGSESMQRLPVSYEEHGKILHVDLNKQVKYTIRIMYNRYNQVTFIFIIHKNPDIYYCNIKNTFRTHGSKNIQKNIVVSHTSTNYGNRVIKIPLSDILKNRK